MKPLMWDDEIELFKKYVVKSQKYFEFGSGGSTLYVIENTNDILINSVETDNKWIDKLSDYQVIQNKLKNNTLKFFTIDIQCIWWKHVSWNPDITDCRNKDTWPSYSKSILNCEYTPDLILVDGRFRVASALESIKKMDEHTFLLFHDYTIRPQYYVVEKFFDKIECISSLQVFKKKEIIDIDELNKTIEDHRLIID